MRLEMAPVIFGRNDTNELHGRGINLFIISIVFPSAAMGLVMNRIFSRIAVKKQLGRDDYTIAFSMVYINDYSANSLS